MTSPQESPGGVPRPPADLPEQQTAVPPVDVAEAQDVRQEPAAVAEQDGDGERGGIPAGQVVMGGASALAISVLAVLQVFGTGGLAVAGAAVAGAGALYVRHRRGQGQSRREQTVTTSRTAGTGRAGRLGGLGGFGGRGRSAGPGRSGRSGAGRTGGPAGSGRSGRSGSRIPGLGGGKTSKASKTGGRSGSGSGRSGAGRTGSAGRFGTSRGTGGRSGGKTGQSGGRSGSGRSGAGRTAGPGPVGRAVRAAAQRMDSATGGRASKAARKAGTWIDAKTGGRAGRAVKAWRRYRASESTGRRWLRWGVLGGVAGLAMGLPVWLLAAGAAACGTAAWVQHRRGRRTATGQKAQEDEDQKQGQGQEQGQDDTAAAPNGQGAQDAQGPAAAPVRDHTNTRRTNSTNRRFRVTTTETAGFPIAQAAAEVNVVAAGYAPADMWTVAADLKQLPDVFASIALALRTYTQRLEGQYPIHPAVVEQIGLLYQGLTQLAVSAQEVEPIFRRCHDADLARGENPRPGESAWNV